MNTKRFIPFLLLLLGVLPAWSQCSTSRKQSFLVSDRYRDAAYFDQHLLLANSHGLVIRNLGDPDPEPQYIESLSGNIIQVEISGTLVVAMAEDSGLHLLSYTLQGQPPTKLAYQDVPGIKSIAVVGETIFARVGSRIRLYRYPGTIPVITQNVPLILLDEIELDATQMVADESLLYVRNTSGGVDVVSYNQQGFTSSAKRLTLNGANNFYGIHYSDGRLILDGLDGVSWATLSPTAQVLSSGFYFKNQGSDIVLGSHAADGYLYLRFVDRIEVKRFQGNVAQHIGNIDQEFADVGDTTLVGTGNYLHLLNKAPGNREWSLASYSLGNNSLTQNFRLEAVFEELVAGGSLGELGFVAANRKIYAAEGLAESGSFTSLTPIYTSNGNIQQTIASDTVILITSAIPGSGNTHLGLFKPTFGSLLDSVYLTELSGSLQQISQHKDNFAFVQFFRTTTEDIYRLTLVSYSDQFVSTEIDSFQKSVPLGAENPFEGAHLSDVGLVYMDGNDVRIHPDIHNLNESYIQEFPRPLTLVRLFGKEGHLWVETEIGLYLYKLNEDRSVDEVGYYPHWRNITRLPSNKLLAQNVRRLRSNPGAYHQLHLDYGKLVNDVVDFTTSDAPIFIIDNGEDIMVGERASLNIYQFECPSQDYAYLIPVEDSLELDLTTNLDDVDVITMTIYNESGEIIGLQDLDRDLIGIFNGRKIWQWLFDYNNLEEPVSFLLTANRPLAPVISGNGLGSEIARFAYQVPRGGASELYVPHVPSDVVWNTQVNIRGSDLIAHDNSVQVINPSGEGVDANFDETGTAQVTLEPALFGQTWARVSSRDLGVNLGGFSLYRDHTLSRAAAVPLIDGLSDILIVPYLAGRNREGDWSGLVLANPHATETAIRFVGFDRNGEISSDQQLILEPRSRMSVSAELWLSNFDTEEETRWLTLVADQPIMGLVIYGSSSEVRLSGIPLSGTSGDQLVFSGVRQNIDWWTNLQITNATPGKCQITLSALDGMGETLAAVQRDILPRESLSLKMDGLFENLSTGQLANVQTVLVSSDVGVCGFLTRGHKNLPTQESVCALVLDKE